MHHAVCFKKRKEEWSLRLFFENLIYNDDLASRFLSHISWVFWCDFLSNSLVCCVVSAERPGGIGC